MEYLNVTIDFLKDLIAFRLTGVGSIEADRANDQLNSAYTTLPFLLETYNKQLAEHNMILQQFEDFVGGKVIVSSRLIHVSGGMMICGGEYPIMESKRTSVVGMQKIGATISYARRYQAFTLIGTASTAEFDDEALNETEGDESTGGNDNADEGGPATEPAKPKTDPDRQAVIDKISAIVRGDVFTEADRIDIANEIRKAKTIPDLNRLVKVVEGLQAKRTPASKAPAKVPDTINGQPNPATEADTEHDDTDAPDEEIEQGELI